MQYIIDTHVLIWYAGDDEKLSQKAADIINNSENEIYLSAASAWEICIKSRIGKIDINPGLFIPECIRVYNLQPLPITINHTLALQKLKEIHKDPFDRILIAQSLATGFPLITSDPTIKKYNTKSIW